MNKNATENGDHSPCFWTKLMASIVTIRPMRAFITEPYGNQMGGL